MHQSASLNLPTRLSYLENLTGQIYSLLYSKYLPNLKEMTKLSLVLAVPINVKPQLATHKIHQSLFINSLLSDSKM